MIKAIVTILFKSSSAIKIVFITFFTDFFTTMRFLFKGLFEILVSGFESINYHIFQPIRLIRFSEFRDFVADNILVICSVFFLIALIYIKTKRDVDISNLKKDN